MTILKLLVSLLISVSALAQQQGSPLENAPSLSAAEMMKFRNAQTEIEAKQNEEKMKLLSQQKDQLATTNAADLFPQQKPLASKETSSEINARNKSPFMIPTELYIKIKRKLGEKESNVGRIDLSIEVRRRWPIKDYTLIGVIWSTKRPKAMIADREGKVHIFKVREFIANAEGYISEINNGEVIVVERGAEVKLRLKEK